MKNNQNILVQVNQVHKSFNKNGLDQEVLKDINLTIKSNEIISFLGKSGAGKSTLLRIISGLLPASSGEVTCKDQVVKSPNANMSMVFQNFALLPWLTVHGNISFGLEARGLNKKYIADKTREMIDLIGLSGYENSYPKELSGGMRQRVGFARALAVEPAVLLLDEAFSSLDIFTATKLRQDLINLWETKKIKTSAIVLVTHNVEETVMMADRVMVWENNPGRIAREITINTPRSLRNKRNMFEQEEEISRVLNQHIQISEDRRMIDVDMTSANNIALAI